MLPRAPVVTPEAVRELLHACVTVVKPGETLLVRIPDDWTTEQMRYCQRAWDRFTADRDLGFTIMFLPGAEFAIAAQPDTARLEGQGGETASGHREP